MKFDISQYRGDYAMHCKTLEDATTFTEYLAKNGRMWCSTESYRNNTHYHKHKEETAYNFNEGKMSYVQWYRENGYTVLEFEDFEWDDDITPPPRAATSSVSIISSHSLLLISYKCSNTRAL